MAIAQGRWLSGQEQLHIRTLLELYSNRISSKRDLSVLSPSCSSLLIWLSQAVLQKVSLIMKFDNGIGQVMQKRLSDAQQLS